MTNSIQSSAPRRFVKKFGHRGIKSSSNSISLLLRSLESLNTWSRHTRMVTRCHWVSDLQSICLTRPQRIQNTFLQKCLMDKWRFSGNKMTRQMERGGLKQRTIASSSPRTNRSQSELPQLCCLLEALEALPKLNNITAAVHLCTAICARGAIQWLCHGRQ